MSELIPIREAARRLGVSDTAIRKAIAAGRCSVADKHPGNGRPLLAWPQVQVDWEQNTSHEKRHRVGPVSGNPTRARYSAGGPVAPITVGQPNVRLAQPAPEDDGDVGGLAIHDGMSLNEAKTAKAILDARMTAIELEAKRGQLVPADKQREAGRKLASRVVSGLYSIPDRISDELACMSDAHAIQTLLLKEIDQAVSELRRTYGRH